MNHEAGGHQDRTRSRIVSAANGIERITIVIGSRNFFGAERRFFKIAEYVDKNYGDQVEVTLALNSSLAAAARRTTWGRRVLERLDANERLIVVPDRVNHTRFARRLWKVPSLLFGTHRVHTVLHGDKVAYFRALLGLPAVLEVTAPGSAVKYANHIPLKVLTGISGVRLLTPSVAKTFERELRGRFDEESVRKVMARSQTASVPYFDLPPTPIDFERKTNTIVSASRFEARKNVLLTAQALALALPELPEWNARIAGQGEDEEHIRESLASLIEEGRVSIGYEPDIESVLSQSKIYVSMIEPDNYPSQAVMEAMHFGNALLLSDVGDTSRFIGDSENGELVERDAEDLARRIVALANDQERLREMGRASMKRVHTVFDPAVHVEEILKANGISISKSIIAS